ncbi:MAG: adenine phosphoribosyltransferase [Clostridia bacterium]|nr:adenine phosphoribosyltransferase [Clostridia bacterium]
MNKAYTLRVAGLERQLPLCPLNDRLCIGAFIIFGDVELTCACARELLKIAPEHDVMITSESKGIPLVYEMARQAGENNYIVARKMQKLYMSDTFSCEVNSITTAKKQTLYLDGKDAALMRGKRVLIVDDVISTGDSLRAIEELVEHAGGHIVGKMAVLAEGDAKDREDIRYLQVLPLFNADGTEILHKLLVKKYAPKSSIHF